MLGERIPLSSVTVVMLFNDLRRVDGFHPVELDDARDDPVRQAPEPDADRRAGLDGHGSEPVRGLEDGLVEVPVP